MKPGNRALAIAALMFVMTAWAALWNVDNRDGVHCGSWLSPNDQNAVAADYDYAESRRKEHPTNFYSSTEQVESCAKAHEGREQLLIVFTVVALAALVLGVIRRYQPRGAPSGPAS